MENTRFVTANESSYPSYPPFPVVFEQVALGIAYVSLEGKWLGMNEHICTIIGYSRRELQQKTIQEIVFVEDRDRNILFPQSLLAREIPSYTQQIRYVCKDGTLILVNQTMALICDYSGKPWYGVLSMEDIHEWLQKEETPWLLLAKEKETIIERRLEQANEYLGILQAITDTALTHLNLDAFFQAVLGRISEIMKADNITLLLLDEDAHFLKVRAVLGIEEAVASEVCIPVGQGFAGRIVAQCKPMIVQENIPMVVLTPVLRQEIHSLLGVPLIGQGKVMGVIHIGMKHHRDFTEEDVQLFQRVADRLALEMERSMLYEQALQARQDSLIHAERLTAINQFLRDFISIASHEFRTALTSIQGFSGLLCSENIAQEEVRAFGCDIYTASQRLTHIIGEILDLERMREGESGLHLESFDLILMLQEEIQHVQMTTAKHTFHLSCDTPFPKVEADREKLRRVLSNLLSNAIKYSPQGGPIELVCKGENNHLHLSICDHGVGIAPEAIEKLFTPYARIGLDKTRYIQGTGLGLSIVHHIIEMHQGRVWAESVLGQGSIFHIHLPITQSP